MITCEICKSSGSALTSIPLSSPTRFSCDLLQISLPQIFLPPSWYYMSVPGTQRTAIYVSAGISRQFRPKLPPPGRLQHNRSPIVNGRDIIADCKRLCKSIVRIKRSIIIRPSLWVFMRVAPSVAILGSRVSSAQRPPESSPRASGRNFFSHGSNAPATLDLRGRLV